jgi:hypothetical protein
MDGHFVRLGRPTEHHPDVKLGRTWSATYARTFVVFVCVTDEQDGCPVVRWKVEALVSTSTVPLILSLVCVY